MLPPHSIIVLLQMVIIGLLDATFTAFKVPISFALALDLNPRSPSCIMDELAGVRHTLCLVMTIFKEA